MDAGDVTAWPADEGVKGSGLHQDPMDSLLPLQHLDAVLDVLGPITALIDQDRSRRPRDTSMARVPMSAFS